MEAAKRDSILQEAKRVFARFGFHKASVDEIARGAGVAKGTIYLAAPSKKDLFYEVLLIELRAWNAEMSRMIDPRKPADELIVEIAWASIRSMDKRPLVRDLLLGVHAELVPDLEKRLDELRSISIQPIGEVVRLGIKQGRFREELDVEEVAGVLLDLHCSTLMFHARGPDRDARIAKRAPAAFDLILRGLCKAAPPATATD